MITIMELQADLTKYEQQQEQLIASLRQLDAQREQLTANINAVGGVIQYISMQLVQSTAPNSEGAR